MNDIREFPALAPSSALRIDQVCDRFEAAWKAGQRPNPEDFLDTADEPERSELLHQLLLLDWDYRLRAGDEPRAGDYYTRFPSDSTLIEVVGREIAETSGGAAAAGVETELTPRQEGDRYDLGPEIGHGGIGVVFRGRDHLLGRDLAVKVLGDAHSDKPEARRRFINEARVGSQLQHPAIVPVYDFGWFGVSRPYFTMKLVEGSTLAALLKSRLDTGKTLPRWLGIFEQVCQAIAYAHDAGVVHRDLKPANIMVGAFGEVQVMDWGFAKKSQDGPAHDALGSSHSVSTDHPESISGALMGTPAYMPTEQARGQTSLIDARVDVFALGAILCEILTGLPPYGTGGAEEIYAKASAGDLRDAHARLDACGADEALRGLAKRCLSAERSARPANAAEVVNALSAFLASAEERTRQAQLDRAAAEARALEAGATARVERRARRLTLALAAATVGILALGAAGFIWNEHIRQARAVRQATTEIKVEAALTDARGHVDRSDWPQARAAVTRASELLESGASDQWHERVDQLRADLDLAAEIEQARMIQGTFDFASRRFPREKALPHYAVAFSRYGIPAGSDVGEVTARIAHCSGPVRDAVVTGFDNWWLIALRESDPVHNWLRGVLDVVDTDSWRAGVREAVAHKDRQRLEKLVVSEEIGRQSPAAVTSLAWALLEMGAADAVIRLLRPAQQRYPSDYWINLNLAQALSLRQPPLFAESLRHYSIVRALRPETPIYVNLGYLLIKQQDWDGVIAVSRRAIELASSPDQGPIAEAYNHLGIGLAKKGDSVQAEWAFRKALEINPDLGIAHYNLGRSLRNRSRVDEAVIEYETAVRLVSAANAAPSLGHGPYLPEEVAGAYYSLGEGRYLQKQYDAALAAYDKAIALHPNYAAAHFERGNALDKMGRVDESIAEYEHAIRLDPKLDRAHYNLGVTWQERGRLDRAIAAYRKAIEANPSSAASYYNLGAALRDSDDPDGAIAAFRKACELDPKLAQAHWSLGAALLRKGHFREALEWIERGHQLGAQLSTGEPPEPWLKKARRYAQLETRLPRILDGSERPATAAEQLEFALVCKLKGQSTASARFYAGAFAEEPALALKDDNRYQAACVAALAGTKSAELSDAERTKRRTLALDWLRDELALRKDRLRQAPENRASLQRDLDRWRREKALAGIREPEELAKLPEIERSTLLRFWVDVQETYVSCCAANS